MHTIHTLIFFFFELQHVATAMLKNMRTQICTLIQSLSHSIQLDVEQSLKYQHDKNAQTLRDILLVDTQ